jgi:hypothetical protein
MKTDEDYEVAASGFSDSWLLVFLSVAPSGDVIMANIFEMTYILLSSKKMHYVRNITEGFREALSPNT